MLVIASLTAVALLLANLAGVWLLRSYLTDQLDDRIVNRMEDPVMMINRICDTGSGSAVDPGEAFPPGGPPQRNHGWPGPLAGPEQLLSLYRLDGTLLCTDRQDGDAQVEQPDVLAQVGAPEPTTVRMTDGTSWRITVQEVSLVVNDTPVTLLTLKGASLADIDRTANGLLLINLAVELVVLLLLGLFAAVVVRLGLHPLTRMEAMATRISTGDLSHRADDADPHTEPGRLGIALNSMLARIEAEVSARTASEARLRQFVADAGHELRTPLTSIRGFAELYRRGGSPPGPVLDETMSRIESEAARMGLLVEDLLLLAKLDEQRPLQRRPVDMLQIAADTIRDAHARAPGRPIRLAALGPDDDADFEPITVLGDEHRLRQVATNLVNNALVHTPPDARITIRVGRWTATHRAAAPPAAGMPGYGAPAQAVAGQAAGRQAVAGQAAGHQGTEQPPFAAAQRSRTGRQQPVMAPIVAETTAYAVLEVSDTGPGIPPEHAERVFERLYRVESSRARGKAGAGGSGLGLSIVAAIVATHGGHVELMTAPGQGATFRVLLPVE
ncbi:two-component system OmpR family sensor kinase [Catenuloplanes nepalensis]|uniref:histidine kinase n=1 Tax=Catenuloplanes nepalensis TaxID=587533 RepID=A0ABT9N5J2_9ACTN|nr:HAMP domain-containing sensor histidine kinase [Catenuloplanes nepalensis]MDP9798798.1 two-component system OmpR family sensor kinase [Catenuloplanes nepalensis]